MKTKEEIIIETIRHYTVEGNPRSLNENGACVYHGNDGEECAFQRVLTKEGKELTKHHENHTARPILKQHGFEIIKEEYRIKDIDFWMLVQSIHDHSLREGVITVYARPDIGIDWSKIEEGIKDTGVTMIY